MICTKHHGGGFVGFLCPSAWGVALGVGVRMTLGGGGGSKIAYGVARLVEGSPPRVSPYPSLAPRSSLHATYSQIAYH